MGGVTVLFAGDFRQTLPVVPRGTRACLKKSYIWSDVKKLSISTNMRVQISGNSEWSEFSDLLLSVGSGTCLEQDGRIALTNLCKVVNNVQALISFIYPDIKEIPNKPSSWFKERAILAPKNDTVAKINNLILDQFDSPDRTYNSVESTIDEEDSVHYPLEFLNSLILYGLPPHELYLKIGAPIMLLRNLSPPKLCNGTRLIVNGLRNYLIEATILTGAGQGEKVVIPRIPMITTDLPFTFKRLQFPIKVCFAPAR